MTRLAEPPRATAKTQQIQLRPSPTPVIEKKVALLVLAVALVSLLPTLGVTGIIDPSDGFFAESAREMFERKDFITPTLNYAPYNDKPILTHWMIALSYAIFGVSEYTSRLPSALCASIICVATFSFARRYLNLRAAWFSSIVLVSSYLFSILARVSLTDMPLTLFVTLSLFGFYIGWKEQSKKFLLAGWAALGGALLAKGPIAFLIVAGSFLIFFLAKEKRIAVGKTIKEFSSFKSWKGVLLAIAIAVPWYVAVGIATKGQYLIDFLFVQNFARAAGTLENNHAQPFWFYLPIVVVTLFPWSAIAPFMQSVYRKWWKKRSIDSSRTQLLLFCASICFTVFSGFSVLTSKLPTYMLPLYPAAAILIAAAFDTSIRLRNARFLAWGSILVSIASLAAMPKLCKGLHADTTSEIASVVAIFVTYAVISGIFAVSVLAKKRLKQAAHGLMLGYATLSAVLIPFLFVQFYEYHQRGYAELLNLAISRKPESISEVWCSNPSAPFYAKKRVPNLQSYYDYAATLAFPGEHIVLYQEGFEKFVSKAPIRKLLGVRGEWRLESVADPGQLLLMEYSCIEANNRFSKLKK